MDKYLRDRYQLQKVIGKGGMGKVYRAFDTQKKQLCAIKQNIIIVTGNNRDVITERLKREFYFLSKIDHRNVIKAYDFFAENHQYFLVVEYVPGLSLKEFIHRKNGDLSLEEQLCIAVQICRAIDTINTIGLIHRDVKPSNIILNEDKHVVKLLDLGVAKAVSSKLTKITQDNSLVGTLGYMSPEQLHGKVEQNTDVFCLAIVLYQFFTWQHESPFHSKSPAIMIDKIQSSELPALQNVVPKMNQDFHHYYLDINNILQQALCKNPEQRTPSADLLAEKLQGILEKVNIKEKTNWRPTAESSYIVKRKLVKLEKEYQNYCKKQLVEKYKQPRKKLYRYYIASTCIVIAGIIISYYIYDHNKRKEIFQKSLSLYLKGEYLQAKQKNQQILATNNIKSLILQALILHQTQNIKSAEIVVINNFQRLTKLNDSFSWYAQGILYKHGIGIKKDIHLAVKWLKKASKNNNFSATLHLIDIFEKHKTALSQKDYIALLYKAAKKQHSVSIKNLADIYYKGQIVNKNIEKALYWYKKLAENGDNSICLLLADVYLSEKKYQQRKQWLIKAAENKSANAKLLLAETYYYGIGEKVNFSKAKHWGKRAAETGELNGIIFYTKLLNTSGHNPIKWHKIAAKKGHVKSMRYLANHFYKQKRFVQAFKWMKKAASQDDAPSMSNLGTLYALGNGVRQDFKTAYKWFHKSAQMGHFSGMSGLSKMYARGDGVEKNIQTSIKWLEKAANAGGVIEMRTLGQYHMVGQHVTKDLEKARYWLTKATQKNDLIAQRILKQLAKKDK
ncbi:serine/threonine-protein kinase [Candidatus Uabimicrobium sp. HlEnr_7]|uniref:serine/threonine-protein kinase n=1 Tax=Candidatus Uabimicrobium helgolandensis TaxID=3095367 RepID=UPI003557EEE7